MHMRLACLLATALVSPLPAQAQDSRLEIVTDCLKMAHGGVRRIAEERADRFQGKVDEPVAGCRGGERAVAAAWRTLGRLVELLGRRRREHHSRTGRDSIVLRHLTNRNTRGIDGALMDLEYQRMELIKFNLFENKTYEQYVTGRKVGQQQIDGSVLKVWKEMRLDRNHPNFGDVQILSGGDQRCKGPLIRFRTVDGICNDIDNPAMGSTGMLFARNVQFEFDLSGSRPRPARAQPPRRAHLAAQARSAGDQPQAVHARPDRHAELQQGSRHARRRRRLRLPEGAVLQRDRGVLDPVHDA